MSPLPGKTIQSSAVSGPDDSREDGSLARACEAGQVRSYPAQVEIFRQDTPAHAVYRIEKGLVKLVRFAPNGHHVIAGLRKRQWIIGAPAVLLEKPYAFTAVTVFPSVIRCIPAKVFLELSATDIRFASDLHRMLSQEIMNQMRNLEAMSCMSAEDRVVRFLCELIAERPQAASSQPAAFPLPLAQNELAQLIAITPEHLCRVFKKLERKGLIRRENDLLIVAAPGEFCSGQ